MKAYEIIVDKVIEGLEKGFCAWQKPWQADFHNYSTKTVYKGINVLSVIIDNWIKKRFEFQFLTFNQIQKLGGKLKKGSKSVQIVKWSFIEKEKNGKTEKVAFCRYFNVFGASDIEGIEFNQSEKVEKNLVIEDLLNKHGVKIQDSSAAYITLQNDNTLFLPPQETFKDTCHYHKTLFHELGHLIGLKIGHIKDNSHERDIYAKEELTAELFANILASELNISVETAFDNSIAYLCGWSKKLKADKKVLISALSMAQKRIAFVLASESEEQAIETQENEIVTV